MRLVSFVLGSDLGLVILQLGFVGLQLGLVLTWDLTFKGLESVLEERGHE